MFSNPSVIDELKSHPLYQEAFAAFKSGDQKKGMELMHQLQQDPKIMNKVNKFCNDDNKFQQYAEKAGQTLISKDQPIPVGYNRNSFSEKTCITTQQKDLPEWEGITAVVEYDNREVYEDYYMMDFTTKNMLYTIRKNNPGHFVGKIKSQHPIKNTIGKFKKNSLHRIINKLYIELEKIEYSVIEILTFFMNQEIHEHLTEITILHLDKDYDENEIKNIKKLFKKVHWTRLKFKNKKVEFELTK